MMLTLWIVTGLLAIIGLVIVAWPAGPRKRLAPVPARRPRPSEVVKPSPW